jgi:hypothetical protein
MEFDYFSLNWCNNTKGVGYNPELRGQSLRGTPLVETSYFYNFLHDRNQVACWKTLTQSEIQSFSFYIQHNYTYSLYLDDLPSAVILRDINNREQAPNYQAGIPIGVFDYDPETNKQRVMVYNHYDITVLTHSTIDGHQRIVGFEVEPFSLTEDDQRDSNNPFTSGGP